VLTIPEMFQEMLSTNSNHISSPRIGTIEMGKRNLVSAFGRTDSHSQPQPWKLGCHSIQLGISEKRFTYGVTLGPGYIFLLALRNVLPNILNIFVYMVFRNMLWLA
jgi:hypothetical protein